MNDQPYEESKEAIVASRRHFMRTAGAASLVGGMALLDACGSGGSPSPTPTPTPSPTPTSTPTSTPTITEIDYLNALLSFKYLQAQFLLRAAFGETLPANLTSGSGTPGAVTGGRQVSFTDTTLAEIVREIARDEVAQITALRALIGTSVVAQPAINIDVDEGGAFTAAMRRATIVSAPAVFDAYASDGNFLLAALLLKDTTAAASIGVLPNLTTSACIDAMIGLSGAEALHAGVIRTMIYRTKTGAGTSSLMNQTINISNLRDDLDGPPDSDEGVFVVSVGAGRQMSRIGFCNLSAQFYIRSVTQALSVFYLNFGGVTSGAFFPAGVNGVIRASGVT
jgi:hypothetical protein